MLICEEILHYKNMVVEIDDIWLQSAKCLSTVYLLAMFVKLSGLFNYENGKTFNAVHENQDDQA